MLVAVPIKSVEVLDEEFDLLDGGQRVDDADVERALNEWDEFSLEAALQLKEGPAQAEVVVVTVGDEDAEEALLSCLARGADRAIRVWDDGLEDCDALGVAQLLAAALRPLNPELVLCGAQSSDAANAATGVALGALLGAARAAVVRRLDLEDGHVLVDRELEGGTLERLRLPLPALLTVQTGINQPRYANLRGVQQARSKPMSVVDLSELGLDEDALGAASRSQRRHLAVPQGGGAAEMLEGSPEDIAAQIAQIVKERLGR